jgi:flagellar protein FliO/FliZ
MAEADILRVIVSLIFVIMLILAGAWFTRRAGWLRSGKAPAMRVLGAQSLGGRAYVAMVEVEDARLVLGVTANQVSLLHTLPPATTAAYGNGTGQASANTGMGGAPNQPSAPAEAAVTSAPARFSHVLNNILRR